MSKNNCIQRLNRDFKDLSKNPIKDAAVGILGENIKNLHCNLIIPEGPYEGLLVHFILDIPDSYPINAPGGRMAPNFPFTGREHEHIYSNGLCNDYLSNFEGWFKSVRNNKIIPGTGWNPAITLKTLLMVMKNFFANTDLDYPSEDHIQSVFNKVRNYKCIECSHCYDKPFPKLPKNGSEEVIVMTPMERVKNNLTCSISKENYIENKNMILGYPIDLSRDKRNRLWSTLIPELVSYDQYILQIQHSGFDKLDDFDNIKLRTATGKEFSHWLSIYINEEHFEKNIVNIENTISVIYKGIRGKKTNDFEPFMVLYVLPSLMNKMVVSIMTGSTFESESAIFAYCHYLKLLSAFIKRYPELKEEINTGVQNFISRERLRMKDKLPDIGEFLIKIALSSFSLEKKELKEALLQEYYTRQVFWINKNGGYNDLENLSVEDKNTNIFAASFVSNKLLVFNILMIKYFITDDFMNATDDFSLPSEKIITSFQNDIKKVKDINSYESVFEHINFDLNSSLAILKFLNNAIKISNRRRYTNLNIKLITKNKKKPIIDDDGWTTV